MAMIEMALEAEPESSELLQLKADLNTLIQLTEESLAEENAKVSRDISHLIVKYSTVSFQIYCKYFLYVNKKAGLSYLLVT